MVTYWHENNCTDHSATTKHIHRNYNKNDNNKDNNDDSHTNGSYRNGSIVCNDDRGTVSNLKGHMSSNSVRGVAVML